MRWDLPRWVAALTTIMLVTADAEAGGFQPDWRWTPVGGVMDYQYGPIYGTQGLAADANRPGARVRASGWSGSDGSLWFFGGSGYDVNNDFDPLCDLWRYCPAAGQWMWVKGSNQKNQAGNYGTMNTAAPGNWPGSRRGAATWRGLDGTYWLFGGEGSDGAGAFGRLADLWQYSPATGLWTWVKGGNVVNLGGVYGTPLTPHPNNRPGARLGAAAWTAADGSLWLFGGHGYDMSTSLGYLSDVWKYDPTTGQWTWIKGPSSTNQGGVYGTQGQGDPLNTPGARWYPMTWYGAGGSLWLMGGFGYDGSAAPGALNDVWQFDTISSGWTWRKGEDTREAPGVYGERGVFHVDNTPGAREAGATWVDSNSGDFILFGGRGQDTFSGKGDLNDFWRFDPDNAQWAWQGGATIVDQPGVYGTRGMPDSDNIPAAQSYMTTWKSAAGDFWLAGGEWRQGDMTHYRNEIWRYNPVTGQWTWVEGTNQLYQLSAHGTQGAAAPGNFPGARQVPGAWADSAGDLWLFGGYGYDPDGQMTALQDLWKYDSHSGVWIWVKGAREGAQPGLYGTQGTPSADNMPGGRAAAHLWGDVDGGLWVFGGYGVDATGGIGLLNDLWRIDPASGVAVWLHGDDSIKAPGAYGTLGVPSTSNVPGAREGAAVWTDGINSWVFGGWGIDGDSAEGDLNDVWRFDSDTEFWTWIHGADQVNHAGVFGPLGQAGASYQPGARDYAASWRTPDGALWVFGGWGYDGSGVEGELNDLWKFDVVSGQWAWMGGSMSVNQAGVYGALGTPAESNAPGGRDSPMTWTDPDGDLWLMGGWGYDATGAGGWLNDVWRYDHGTGQWTWIHGSSQGNPSSTVNSPAPRPARGAARASDSSWTPGGRSGAARWRGADGALWLFGGEGYDAGNRRTTMGDLWRLDDITLEFRLHARMLSFPASASGLDLNGDGIVDVADLVRLLSFPKP